MVLLPDLCVEENRVAPLCVTPPIVGDPSAFIEMFGDDELDPIRKLRLESNVAARLLPTPSLNSLPVPDAIPRCPPFA